MWRACFDSWHNKTSGDSTGIDVIPVDPMDSIRRLRTPLSKYFLHFRFHLLARLPVTRVDSTVLPVSFFDQTPLDSRFCPLESSREYWSCVLTSKQKVLQHRNHLVCKWETVSFYGLCDMYNVFYRLAQVGRLCRCREAMTANKFALAG